MTPPVASVERIEESEVIPGTMFSRHLVPTENITTIDTGLAKVLTAVTSIVSTPASNAFIATVAIGDQAGSPPAGSIIISLWKMAWSATELVIELADEPFPEIDWIAVGDSK
jgi:hypothetical protein